MNLAFEDASYMHVDSDSDHESIVSVYSDEDVSIISGSTTLEIDSYAYQYKGYMCYYRLAFIARYCPQLADEALSTAISYIRKSGCKDFNNFKLLCNWLYKIRKGEDVMDSYCIPYSILINGFNVNCSFTNSRLTVMDQSFISLTTEELDKELKKYALQFPSHSPSVTATDVGSLTRNRTDNTQLNGNAMATGVTNKELYSIPFDVDWVTECENNFCSFIQSVDEDLKQYSNVKYRETFRATCLKMIDMCLNAGDINRALKHASMVLENSSLNSSNDDCTLIAKAIDLSLMCRGWSALERFLNRFVNCFEIVCFYRLYYSNTGHRISSIASSGPVATKRSDDMEFESEAIDEQSFMHIHAEKMRLLMRYVAAKGVMHMAHRKYDQAANAFFEIRIDYFDYPEILSSANIAQYGALCALFAYDRSEMKKSILNCHYARQILDMDTEMRDILLYFYEAKYGLCLKKLSEVQNNLKLDIFLAEHVDYLAGRIRNKAVSAYFHPFASVQLSKAALEFHISVSEMEDILRNNILKEKLVARIDGVKKIVYTNMEDQRTVTCNKTLELIHEYEQHVKAIVLSKAVDLSNIPLTNSSQSQNM